MTRTGYDSDNIDDIPEEAEVVFFYADGEPGTPTTQQLQRFQGRTLIPITRKVGVKAKVADVEPGCIWPPSEARQQFEQGLSDTVYCNWSEHTEVMTALQGLTYNMWLGQWDSNPELPVIEGTTVVAKQYGSPANNTSPGHYDLSSLADNWPTASTPQENPVTHTEPVQDPPVHADPTDAPLGDADNDSELQAPVVDAVWVSGGCYMVAADGGVFCSDAAVFHGSMAGHKLNAAVCAILVADHTGYTLVAEDGGTFRFGNGPEVPAL